MSQKSVSQKSTSTTTNTKNTQEQSKRPVPKVFLSENFNIKGFSLTEFEKNERVKSQYLAYPRYNDGQVRFQTGEFTITQYGLPPIGEYAKSDDDYQRKMLKVVLDPTQPACVELNTMFSQIDKYAVNNQKKFFTGPLSKLKYVYKTIVREPQEQLIDDEEEDPKKAG